MSSDSAKQAPGNQASDSAARAPGDGTRNRSRNRPCNGPPFLPKTIYLDKACSTARRTRR